MHVKAFIIAFKIELQFQNYATPHSIEMNPIYKGSEAKFISMWASTILLMNMRGWVGFEPMESYSTCALSKIF
jgi:hypothetical protein